jgi:hypothetical protein
MYHENVCVCVCVLFQSVQGVFLGAKHPGMLGLAVVGTRCGRTGQRCVRVLGTLSAHMRGSHCAGHGMSHWHGMWWMSCIARCLDHRASQGYKKGVESSGSGYHGQCEFCGFAFPCFFHR